MCNFVMYGFLSLIFSLLLIPLFKSFALKMGIVDVPDGKIKVHTRTTPYLGGVAILCASLLLSMFIFSFNKNLLSLQFYDWLPIFGLLGLAFLGFVDDLIVISPLQKFVGQIAIATLFIYSGCCLRSGYISTIASRCITIFWFVFVSNALNLVDIMDGLAGTITLLALIFFGVWSYIVGNYWLTNFIVILAASVVAFLWNNKPRATIYLGDSGALFLGGFLALFPFILHGRYENNLHIFFTTIIVLGIPLAETLLLIIIRTHKKIPFYRGSPHHFVCYLKNKGWTEIHILGFVAFIGVALGVCATLFLLGDISFCATLVYSSLMLFFSVFLIYR